MKPEVLEHRRQVGERFLERRGIPAKFDVRIELRGVFIEAPEADRGQWGADFADDGECVHGGGLEGERTKALNGRDGVNDPWVFGEPGRGGFTT